MNRAFLPTLLTSFIAAASNAGALAETVGAVPPIAEVVAQRDHYQFGMRTYGRLDLLESAVRDTRPAAVRIEVCGPRAARAFKAVAHRLSDFPLEVTMQDEDAAACSGQAYVPIAVLQSRPLPDIDDEAVERYWQGTMP